MQNNTGERAGKQHHVWDPVGIQGMLYLVRKPERSALKRILLIMPEATQLKLYVQLIGG